MKTLRLIVINLMMLSYVALSLITLENCADNKRELSTSEYLKNEKRAAVKLLQNKFDCEQFNCNVKNLLGKTVVVDSTLIGLSEKGNELFLNAKVNASCAEKYFLRLKCSGEVIEQFKKTKSNNAIIAAKIFRMDNKNIFANADSLDGAKPTINLGEVTLLTGECLEIKEITLTKNAN